MHIGKHTYEPAQPKRTGTGHRSHFVWKFTGKMPDLQPARGILCRNLQEKCRWSTFCASLRSRNAHGHFGRAIFCGNLQEKMTDPSVNTSIEHKTFTLTVRTPQGGHTVWGKKNCSKLIRIDEKLEISCFSIKFKKRSLQNGTHIAHSRCCCKLSPSLIFSK